MKLFSITMKDMPYSTLQHYFPSLVQNEVEKEQKPIYYSYLEVNSQPAREKDVKEWDLFSRSMA